MKWKICKKFFSVLLVFVCSSLTVWATDAVGPSKITSHSVDGKDDKEATPPIEGGVEKSKSIYDFDWKWTNEVDKQISFADLSKGGTAKTPLVITMTYTSCKMSCPTTIRTLQKVSKDLEKKSIHAHFIIVSFDPRMDTPRRLSNYKKSWKLPDETWHFLTGNEKELKGLEDYLHFNVTYIDDHFIHDSKITIIGEDGKIKETFENWNSNIIDALTRRASTM